MKKQNNQLIDTLASTLMGMAGLFAGVYLLSIGQTQIGSALLGAISSAYFLHSQAAKVTNSLTASVDNVLNSLLNNASTATNTSTKTSN